MAGSGTVQVPPDSTGSKIDCTSISAGGTTVMRQRVVIADPTASAGFAVVTAGSLQVLVKNASIVVSGQVSVTGGVAISNTVTVTGQVSVTGSVAVSSLPNVNISAMPQVNVLNVAGTAHIGEVNISTMPAVNISAMPAVVLAAGANNIGSINNISATVNVAGTFNVSLGALAAGTNNIGTVGISSGTLSLAGTLDGISATVNVAVTNQVNIGNISATVNVAGTFTIGTIDKISATVTVAGIIQLAAGSNEIGYLKGISGTIQAVVTGFNAAVNISAMPAVVVAAGTNNIGTINNISATVNVAGTFTIGTIDKISATVTVAGLVQLAAGTNNIGTIQAISAPVTLANGATVNISTMPAVNISAMPTVNVNLVGQSANYVLFCQGGTAFNSSVTAGTAPMLAGGRVKTSISTTATSHAAVWAWFDKAGHQIVQLNAASLHPSATHGPKSVTLSASANTVLVASAGTACIFVDSLLVTSNLAGVTRCDIYETASSAAPEVTGFLAIGGGGFTQKFDPPWQLSAGQALSARLKPSASAQVVVCIHFHVGPA